jgi:MFS family permease
MGTCTFLIALLSTDAMVGWIAAALLCLQRFGQGFGRGGEWGGATLPAVANAPLGWRARFGAAPQLGSPLGFLAANGAFLLGVWLSEAPFMRCEWRIPFLLSAGLVLLSLWVRLRIHETLEFSAAIKREPPVRVPVASMLSAYC